MGPATDRLTLKSLEKHKDIGLLLLRIGLGVMFIFHGAPKMFGGPERWTGIGGAMSNFGISFFPALWGFMASFSEFIGGSCIILGLFFRPLCMLLTITMTVAATIHFSRGDGLRGAAHAIENGVVFLGLIFIGPGKYSLDEWLASRKKNNT